MKQSIGRIVLSIIMILVLASVIDAQAGPIIRLPEELFDFGFVPEGLKATHRYWVVNDGDDTLLIQRVQPTCGCTTVPLPTDQVSPGDSVPLDLVFDTQRFKGKVYKSVHVYSNEKRIVDSAEVNLRRIYFMAEIGREDDYVKVEPQTAYLDTVGKTEQVITVTNKDDKPYTVRVSSQPPSYLELDIPKEVIAPKSQAKIVLREGPDTPIGDYTGSMTFTFEGPRTFSVTVPIYGMGYYH